jgi:two-component system LytT family sensor kinase
MGSNWPPKYKTVIQHLLFWLAYILYHVISYGWEFTDQLTFRLAPAIITATLPITIVITYVNLYLLMPLYYYHEKYIRYALSLVLLLLASGIMMRFFTHFLILPWEQVHDPVRYQQETKHFWIPVRILRLSIESCPVIAVTMVAQLMRNAWHRERNLRKLEQEKFTAEMGLLKAQINPHFFFNTLNTLYGLVLKKSEKAGKFALRLSDLMHYMLYEASADKVLLKNEISHIDNYISVEQMRFADRLDLSFQYSGDIEDKLIAPLILLPFIENAFKHGITDDAGWITINIKVINNRLFMKVENSIPANVKTSNHGIGLENVKKRLELTYPARHELKITADKLLFEVDFKLDL